MTGSTFNTSISLDITTDKAKLASVSREIKKLGTQANVSLNQQTQQSFKSQASMTKKALGTIGGMATAGAAMAAVGYTGKKAIEVAKTMQASTAIIRKNLGEAFSQEKVEEVKNKLTGISADVLFTTTQLMEALADLSETEFDNFDELVNSMEDVANLANATGTSLSAAGKMFLNAKGLAKQDNLNSRQIADIMTATLEGTGLDLETLSDLMGKLTKDVQASGLSTEEIMGLIKETAIALPGNKRNITSVMPQLLDFLRKEGKSIKGETHLEKLKNLFAQINRRKEGDPFFKDLEDKAGSETVKVLRIMAKDERAGKFAERMQNTTIEKSTGLTKRTASLLTDTKEIDSAIRKLVVALNTLANKVSFVGGAFTTTVNALTRFISFLTGTTKQKEEKEAVEVLRTNNPAKPYVEKRNKQSFAKPPTKQGFMQKTQMTKIPENFNTGKFFNKGTEQSKITLDLNITNDGKIASKQSFVPKKGQSVKRAVQIRNPSVSKNYK